MTFFIPSGHDELTLDDFLAVVRSDEEVRLDEAAVEHLAAARQLIEDALQAGIPVYGLTMHLGDRRDVQVTPEELSSNQERIVLSHAGSIGEPISREEVRAIMLARLRGFTAGYSGVSPNVAQRYAEFISLGITPVVHRESSIGAADLGHLGAIAIALTGHGQVEYKGVVRPAGEVLEELGLEPVRLSGKDGLALVSSNSYTIGLGALRMQEFARAFELTEIAAALYLEATSGNTSWLNAECSAARPFTGQRDAAIRLSGLLEGSRLFTPGTALSLQDPLSIRSFSHVAGATLTVARRLADDLTLELNSSGDNPMVNAETGSIISSANFNPMEIALGFENLRVALAHLGIIGDQRIQRLAHRAWDHRREGNQQSLLGMLPYAFTAVAAKLRALTHPVTIEIPPLDLGQEDMSSGAPLAIDAAETSIDYLRRLAIGEIVLAVNIIMAERIEVAPGLQRYVDLVNSMLPVETGPHFLGDVLEEISDALRENDTTIASVLGDPSRVAV